MTVDPAADWITCAKRSPLTRLRLFCFPYAGGAAAIYRPWGTPLWPDIEVCPIQLPGRETRLLEPLATRLTALVEPLTAALRTKLDIPFAFFGHSMGGLICFEVMRSLRRLGAPLPCHLFISALRAPQLPDSLPLLHDQPDSVLIDQLARRYGGIPKVVAEDAEVMRFYLPILRADMELCETYRYVAEPKVDCPISVFGGTDDFQICRPDLELWREQTTGAFSLRMLPGDHFFVKSAQTALLAAIADDLELGQAGCTDLAHSPV